MAHADGSATQVLDVYLPEGDGPFPAVVIGHAGAFKFGSKENIFGAVGQTLLDSGYVVVVVGYRLSDEAFYPAAVFDARGCSVPARQRRRVRP